MMAKKFYRIAPPLGLVAIALTAALAFASPTLEDALSEKELETVVHYVTVECPGGIDRFDHIGAQDAAKRATDES